MSVAEAIQEKRAESQRHQANALREQAAGNWEVAIDELEAAVVDLVLDRAEHQAFSF